MTKVILIDDHLVIPWARMRARFRCRLRAALLVGLLARAYTVVVSAAGDAVGTALFEL